MCQVLGVSEPGYYKWVKRGGNLVSAKRSKLLPKIHRVFVSHKKRYGSPRVYQELKREGVRCGENLVALMMREEGLRAKGTKKFKTTTDSWRSKVIADNVLDRKFAVQAINKVWCGDITYLCTREGFMYLAVFLDLYSRRVVGWSLSNTLKKELVLKAFNEALMIRKPPSGMLVHTDRGSQYTANEFRGKAQDNKLTLSMSRKGNCWDNAVVESFFSTLKRELLEGVDVYTRWELERLVREYIDCYYNTKRMHSTLDYLSPIEYEYRAVV